MEELGIEGASNRLWDCWDAYGAADGVEVEAEGLLQQIQLYNVALKQEDGEPVTEDEIRQVEWDWEVLRGSRRGSRVVPGSHNNSRILG